MSLKLCNNCGMASRNLSAAGPGLYCEHCGEPEGTGKIPPKRSDKEITIARVEESINIALVTWGNDNRQLRRALLQAREDIREALGEARS